MDHVRVCALLAGGAGLLYGHDVLGAAKIRFCWQDFRVEYDYQEESLPMDF